MPPKAIIESSQNNATSGRKRQEPIRLALVIPTKREAGNIKELLQRITLSIEPLRISYELIIVDDDSRDGIEQIIEEFASTTRKTRIIVRRDGTGLAGAIVHGWQHSSADILGAIDADLQHPPEILPQLWKGLQSGADIAIGSRMSLTEWSYLRRLVSKLAAGIASPLQRRHLRVSDPLSGFFLVRRSCIDNIDFQPSGFKLLLEILVRGEICNASEIPFNFGTRHCGESKASTSVMGSYLYLVASLYTARVLNGLLVRRLNFKPLNKLANLAISILNQIRPSKPVTVNHRKKRRIGIHRPTPPLIQVD